MYRIFSTLTSFTILFFLTSFLLASCDDTYKQKCYKSPNVCMGYISAVVVEETKYGYKKGFMEVQNSFLLKEVVESQSKR